MTTEPNQELAELIRKAAIARRQRDHAREALAQAETEAINAGSRYTAASEAVHAHIDQRITRATLDLREAGL